MQRSKIQREQPQTYFVLLNNGEQHFIQADSAAEAAALQSQQFIDQQQQQQQQQQQFYDVIDYVEHLYADFASEKTLTQYFCLFCANEFNDMRLLVRHITDAHRARILDGTINLEQDFREIVRNKILSAGQNRTVISTDSQLYQCGQCHHMFHSLEVIAEHFTRCQGVSQQPQPQPQQQYQSVGEIKAEQPMPMSPHIKTESSATIVRDVETPTTAHVSQSVNQNEYVPYGCAKCGRRWYTIYELSQHIIQCQGDTFYDSAKHLLSEYWVEAPKNQHIVINEDSTNVTLKTTGLWLMPEPAEPSDSSDSLRGFWVMPSSTTIYQDHQHERLSTIKSSPHSVISHHQSVPSSNVDYLGTVETSAPTQHISPGDTSDATYQMLNNVDMNQQEQRIYTNTATVITHTSPAVGVTAGRSQRKRGGRATSAANTNQEAADSGMTGGAKRKRNTTKRGSATTTTAAASALIAEELPPEQRYYLTYDENGALVPIQNACNAANATSPSHRSTSAASDIKILDVVDIKNEPYGYGMRQVDNLQPAIQSIAAPCESTETTAVYASTSTSDIITDTNGSNNDFSGYNIDDLSHLDKPIGSNKPIPAIKPLQSKPQFVDSFFSFLMSRDTNKS